MYRQPSTTLQNSTPKLAGQNPKASPNKRSIMEHSPRRPQDIKPLRSCSAGNRALMLLKGHLGIKCHSVTPNMTGHQIPSVQFRKWLNGGDSICIVRDRETIIVLALLSFNFIPQRLHHSLTLPRSRIRDSATVTLMPGDGTTSIWVESST